MELYVTHPLVSTTSLEPGTRRSLTRYYPHVRTVYSASFNLHTCIFYLTVGYLQVHEVDLHLVGEIASFLYLQHCCKEMKPAIAEEEVIDEDSGITFFDDMKVCRIPFQPSVMFAKSQALAFTLAAFSEGKFHYLLPLWLVSYHLFSVQLLQSLPEVRLLSCHMTTT